MRKIIVLIASLVVFLIFFNAISSYIPQLKNALNQNLPTVTEKEKIVTEESVVIDAVKNVGTSVVTVAEIAPKSQSQFLFGPFSIFGIPNQNTNPGMPAEPQNIGSGFIVSSDGLLITNKHVVSDVGSKYQIITNSDKKYDVEKIYRDPLNDIAILQISPSQNPGETLKPVTLGDSSKLVVGQFVIAIGTALGEFRNTVTTGVVSGLGRGITAGSEFQGYVEKLDNVIQTDAAINPGNSGGPLLNSAGQVIGVTSAIAQNGQNIGFALPINLIKDSIKNFNEHGQFNRPYLGVAYKMLSRDVALLNNVPQGAYVQDIVLGSPAQKAGIQKGDIIIKIDGQQIGASTAELSKIVSDKKVGDSISLTIWRNGKTIEVKATLSAAPNQ